MNIPPNNSRDSCILLTVSSSCNLRSYSERATQNITAVTSYTILDRIHITSLSLYKYLYQIYTCRSNYFYRYVNLSISIYIYLEAMKPFVSFVSLSSNINNSSSVIKEEEEE